MTDEKALIAQIHELPESIKTEVAKFIRERLKANTLDHAVKHPRPKAGSMPGKFKIAPNFDDPIEGFEEYM
ncbi:MAG: type II toxin-antitoxin system VapB family antitoxin [Pyrinomonadaceae bacterium]